MKYFKTTVLLYIVTLIQLNAQVIYTDVVPDEVKTTMQFYNLDLDNNGIPDFPFGLAAFDTVVDFNGLNTPVTTDNIALITSISNQVVGSLDSIAVIPQSFEVASLLMSGDLISANSNFVGGTNILGGVLLSSDILAGNPPLALPFELGNFSGQTDAFIGVKFSIGGATHYGWARVDVSSTSEQLTIKDYAYNSAAGMPIEAGNTTSLNESELENVEINIVNDHLFIHNNSFTSGAIVEIYGVGGKLLYAQGVFKSNTSVDLTSLANQALIVRYRNDNNSITKKIVLRR